MSSGRRAASEFPCSKCGLCCQHVHMSEETRFLDRGDGTCRYYADKECSIYSDRPDICRVGRQYIINYHEKYTWDEFVSLNLKVCEELQLKFID